LFSKSAVITVAVLGFLIYYIGSVLFNIIFWLILGAGSLFVLLKGLKK